MSVRLCSKLHQMLFFLRCGTPWLASLVEGKPGQNRMRNSWERQLSPRGYPRLIAGVAADKCVTSTSATESLRATQWETRSQNLQCACHAVERIPVRYVSHNKPTRDDKLLVAFDGLVLSEMLDRTIDRGRIIYGHYYATLQVKTSVLTDDVRLAIEGWQSTCQPHTS